MQKNIGLVDMITLGIKTLVGIVILIGIEILIMGYFFQSWLSLTSIIFIALVGIIPITMVFVSIYPNDDISPDDIKKLLIKEKHKFDLGYKNTRLKRTTGWEDLEKRVNKLFKEVKEQATSAKLFDNLYITRSKDNENTKKS